ncbi:hypothetical protein RB195_010050 [Necator americanus]|uniref:RING-type E3 ubiquitin transferase BRCA1 n=1 Tax=Necator americanus TaxID=51031 RepID=A0ABR1CY09_NECAM
MSIYHRSYELSLNISSALTRIQSELRCGVCRSTFRNPVTAPCSHSFCKECLNQVFKHGKSIECPLCRKSITKRSCTSSEQHESLVKGYLQLGRIFSMELRNRKCSIPKELMYMESQIPTALGPCDSPIRDFRPEPQFVLPKPRIRKKQPLNTHSKVPKMDQICEESECKENLQMSTSRDCKSNEACPIKVKSNILARRSESDLIRYSTSRSVPVQCELPALNCICHDLRGSLEYFKKTCNLDCSSDLQALFTMAPEYKKILEENISMLHKFLPLPSRSVDSELSMKTNMINEEYSGVLPETQPCSYVSDETPLTVEKSEKGSESSHSSGGSFSDVVPQSPQANTDDMDITLRANFESFPQELGNEVKAAPTVLPSMVISVSRLSSTEDEGLVREFFSLFPNVAFHQEIASTSTHLVMMNCGEQTCVRKSLLYVFAVAHKCEILSRRWLEECVQSKLLLPTTPYTLTIDASTSETPGWLRSKSTKIPLFDQMKFFLPRSFSDSELLPLQKLKDLIIICGGSCYDKPWQLTGAEKAYTIFMPRSSNWDAAQRYEASMDGIPVIVADWVLDSIAEFRLMPIDSYRIRKK